VERFTIDINTNSRGLIEITNKINDNIKSGNMCNVFTTHTSASLIITGNEDSNLLLDIEMYFQDNVLDGLKKYKHNNEGDFDVSGHIRSILTGTSINIPIENNKLLLGKYQGVFLYEHRAGESMRTVIVSIF